MIRKSRTFATVAAARADLRRCVRCQQPFSLAIDGSDCPNCGCTASEPAYPPAVPADLDPQDTP